MILTFLIASFVSSIHENENTIIKKFNLFLCRSMNPVPIIDKTIDVIILVFIQIPAHIDQLTLLKMGIFNQEVLVTRVSVEQQ